MITNFRNPNDRRKYSDRWELVSGKRLFSIMDERSSDGSEELLSVSHITGITPRSQKNVTMFKAESLVGYKKCEIGDIAANTMWTWQGAIGVSKYAGVVSPAYNVYRMRDKIYNPRYLDLLLREKHLIDVYHSISTGIRPSRLRLYPEPFLSIALPVPSREEQDQIVRYLDWQVSKINKLIVAKKKVITLLSEQRKAITDEGILHGFASSGTKDSGILWLGSIPKHWTVMPLKRVCQVNAPIAHLTSTLADDTKVTFIPMENVSVTGEVDYTIKKPLSAVRSGFSSFAKDDVVVAKITPCFENGKGACLDGLDTDIGFGTTEFINLRAYHDISPKYLYLITMTRPFRVLGEKVMTGSAGQKRVSPEYIKNFAIGIPPLDEQKRIRDEIERRESRIDDQIRFENESLDLLHDLRTRLISDVVTGQIDVRGIEVPDCEMADEIDAEEGLSDDEDAALEADES